MELTIDSKYLKADNVKNDSLITFKNEGEIVEGGQWGAKFNIKVTTEMGEEKIASLNNSSKSNLIEEYSNDTKKWIGKQARVNIVKQMVGNVMKDVIYFTAPNKDMEGNVILE